MPPSSVPGYSGDITVQQALDRVAAGAVLVDVRTEDEWLHVGVPDVSATGSSTLFVEWNRSDGNRNGAFLNQLHDLKGTELLFICRSGVRSVAAARSAAAAGHTVFNVLHGFEAPGGWRPAGLAESRYTGSGSGGRSGSDEGA